MIKFGMKVLVWLAIGYAIMSGAGRLDIDAASPWQYQLTTSDSGLLPLGICIQKPECLCQECQSGQSLDTVSETGVSKTIDAGVLGFLVALYGAGTVMGMVFRGRQKVSAPPLDL